MNRTPRPDESLETLLADVRARPESPQPAAWRPFSDLEPLLQEEHDLVRKLTVSPSLATTIVDDREDRL